MRNEEICILVFIRFKMVCEGGSNFTLSCAETENTKVVSLVNGGLFSSKPEILALIG